MMKRAIAWACLIYGCIATIGSVVWLTLTCLGGALLPQAKQPAITLMSIHAIVLCLTFQRFIGVRPFWRPVCAPTAARLKWSRRCLLLCATAVVGITTLLVVALATRRFGLVETGFGVFLASFSLLSSVYIAIHWAFRPENIINAGVVRFFADPFSLFRPR
jgi:hypothetical protein